MAHNTKFMGFVSSNSIALERWGKKVTIPVSKESIDAIRTACYDKLPKDSNRKSYDGNSHPDTHYNSELGCIDVRIPPRYAEKIIQALEPLAEAEASSGGNKARYWLSDLKEAMELHQEYVNTEDEPGV